MPEKKKPEIKIAQQVIYYSLTNCISCVYLLPVINYAKSRNLVDTVDIIMARNKVEYKNSVREIIDLYLPECDVFSPVIIMKNPEGLSGIVRPDIVQECANNIIQHLNILGDDATIDFLDGDLELKLFFQNLLMKMAANIEQKLV
ncbi:MAG: hypothetical protein ACTSP4_01215 [Candidatus Hodarchaeales archaeon]